MQINVYQQRRPIHIPGTEDDYEANLHFVGKFEFTNMDEAKQAMKNRFPFRSGVGLGQFPIVVEANV